MDNGDFFVRQRETDGDNEEYVLVLRFNNRPTHHLMRRDQEGFWTINKKTYVKTKSIVEVGYNSTTNQRPNTHARAHAHAYTRTNTHTHTLPSSSSSSPSLLLLLLLLLLNPNNPLQLMDQLSRPVQGWPVLLKQGIAPEGAGASVAQQNSTAQQQAVNPQNQFGTPSATRTGTTAGVQRAMDKVLDLENKLTAAKAKKQPPSYYFDRVLTSDERNALAAGKPAGTFFVHKRREDSDKEHVLVLMTKKSLTRHLVAFEGDSCFVNKKSMGKFATIEEVRAAWCTMPLYVRTHTHTQSLEHLAIVAFAHSSGKCVCVCVLACFCLLRVCVHAYSCPYCVSCAC